MSTLVGIADYARHRKCSRQAVYDALRSGAIVVDKSGKIDLEAADSAWAANIPPEATAPKAAREQNPQSPAVEQEPDSEERDGGESFNAARTRRERANADRAELVAQRERGELVAVAEVQREWFTLGRAMRDRLLGLPDRISADLASMADQHEVRVYLDRELRGALAELAPSEDT
tara:strand:+ start:796 stop:1320 length:525 start_codon:yes stop_codon:yes gene_type:complete